MSPDRWRQIKSILEAALERDAAERPAFLAEACAGDPEMQREVESLLEFDAPEADFIEESVFHLTDNLLDGGQGFVGRRFGKYEIVGELGVGGMGAVFLAERADGEFRQRVALKIIKRGMDSAAIVRRFLNERQILASLRHPNIAHLIDGGTTEDGLPFFVMEYVEGEPITDFAQKHDLALEEKLKLFRQVCAAVSFAHRNLVIHRDLKPSNILVTAEGEPKLLDFGIAKFLKTESGDGNTATQNFAFTPEYASPEQARGEKLTTATDVYSLGVILYELLTGARPYKTESRNLSEIIRLICETEPPRPSAVVESETKSRINSPNVETAPDSVQNTNPKSKIQNPKLLKGDLDNIILKALRKEPERRYSSVEQLSEDLRRHLAGLPVMASRDTWRYRARKFVRRNTYGVGAAALVLLTLLGGLGATLHQANAARREREKAERRFADVRRLSNSFLFEFHDAVENLPGSTAARELVVKRAVEYLDKLAAESADDPSLQRELGTAYAKIGQIQGNSYHSNLGDTDGAMKSYRRSLEIRQSVADADPNNLELQNELADSHEGVGDVLYSVSDLSSALRSYETAIAIREKIVNRAPDDLNFRYHLANVLGKRGDVSGMEGFENLGDVPHALESYRRGISLYEEIVGAQPENDKYRLGYATMLYYFGMLQNAGGDAKGAIASGQKSISILERLIAADPNNQKYETHLMSGLVFMRFPLLDEGRTEEAVANARRVVRTMEKQVAADPKSAYARRSLGVSYNSLGICLLQAGDARQAIENHQKSLSIAEELSAASASSGEKQRDKALTLEFLADAQLKAGDFDAALANYRKALATHEGEKPEDAADSFAALYAGIGKSQAARGELKEAAEYLRRAVPLALAAAQKSPASVKPQRRLADIYFEAGRILRRYSRISRDENAGREACDFLRKSFDIWNALRQAGTLSAPYRARPDEVSRELGACQ